MAAGLWWVAKANPVWSASAEPASQLAELLSVELTLEPVARLWPRLLSAARRVVRLCRTSHTALLPVGPNSSALAHYSC